MRKPQIPNKYDLDVKKVRNLIPDRTKIQEPPFWRNDVIKAWCISGSTAHNGLEELSCDSYWLGVYDEDAPAYAGKIRVTFDSCGGMCGYNLSKFYRPQDMDNETDLIVQEMFLRTMNDLIDKGVFRFSD